MDSSNQSLWQKMWANASDPYGQKAPKLTPSEAQAADAETTHKVNQGGYNPSQYDTTKPLHSK